MKMKPDKREEQKCELDGSMHTELALETFGIGDFATCKFR